MSSDAVATPELEPDVDGSKYVLGPATYRKYARFETKPEAGYERFRSYEDLETQPGGKRDVYVYAHPLLALLHEDVVDLPIGEALEYLEGRDVHHENGVKWDNRLENFELIEHGRHSSITQRELRGIAKAQAADAQRRLEEERHRPPGADECDGCGTVDDDLATIDGVDGEYCLECALERSDGQTIQF